MDLTPVSELLSFISSPALIEAIVLLLLFAVFLRWFLPSMFAFRTKIQSSLEETYETHITELKQIIESLQASDGENRRRMQEQTKHLNSINAKLSALGRILEEYNCRQAPDCNDRDRIGDDIMSLVERSVCDSCVQTSCDGCAYDRILNGDVFRRGF